jgi:hypothetical protein
MVACPVAGGHPVEHRPAPVAFHPGLGSSHALVCLREMRFQFVFGAPVVRIGLVALALKYSDLAVEFASAQWVLDKMQVRSNPVADGVQSGKLDHFFRWDSAAVGDLDSSPVYLRRICLPSRW